jgi:hypothetical protein
MPIWWRLSSGAIPSGRPAQAARRGIPWPESGGVWPAFDAIASTFNAKVAKHLPIASMLSFNEVIMRKLPRGFKKWVGDMKLMELPTRPDFIFNATELQTGAFGAFPGRVWGAMSSVTRRSMVMRSWPKPIRDSASPFSE